MQTTWADKQLKRVQRRTKGLNPDKAHKEGSASKKSKGLSEEPAEGSSITKKSGGASTGCPCGRKMLFPAPGRVIARKTGARVLNPI